MSAILEGPQPCREQRQDQQRLRQWEQMFEMSARAICVSDVTTGLIQSVNPAFARMHRGAIEDFAGRPVNGLLSPTTAGLPGIRSSIDAEHSVGVEFEHMRLDGTEFPVRAETLVVRDTEGIPLCRVAWLEDLTEPRAVEEARREAAETLEIAFSRAPMGVALIGFDGRFLRVNASLCEMLGRTEDELIGSTSARFTHPDDLRVTADSFAHLTTAGTPVTVQKRYLRPDGEVVWASTRGTAVSGSDGAPSHIVSHFHDITAIKVAEQRQAEATTRFETAFADAPIGMAIVALDGHWLRVNRMLCELSGYTEEQLHELTFQDLTHPDDLDSDLEQVEQLLAGGIDRYTMQKRYFTAEGHQIWTNLAVSLVRDSRGQPLHFISQIEDITERKHLEAELQHLADHDPLTELWNRRRFEEELERQINRAQRYSEQGALLILDLDGFKQVNDTYGHRVGDDLLVQVSGALRGRLRATDSLARLGGDEFAVILTNVSLQQATRLAARFQATINDACVTIQSTHLRVTASVGVAALAADRSSGQDAFVEADQAMYAAKANRASGRPKPG